MKRLMTILTCLALLPASNLEAKTWIVKQAGGGDYTTISAAISAATNGDVISIFAGTYTEGLTVNKQLSLIGVSPLTVTVFNNQNAIKISSSNVLIKNLSIRSGSNYGIEISAGYSGASIINNIINNCSNSYGVYTNSSTEGIIANNVFYNNKNGLYTGGTFSVYNNIFHGQGGDGTTSCSEDNHAIYRSGTPTIFNNIFYNNDVALNKNTGSAYYNSFYGQNNTNYCDCSAGIGDSASDPKVTDLSNEDFTLATGSPAIDAGHPSTDYNDVDGSRNDMGVYGGTYSWEIGPTITTITLDKVSVKQGETITVTATAKSN